MELRNKKTQEKHDRNLAIVAEFKKLIKIKGSQRLPIYDELAEKFKVSVSTVGRVVNK